MMKKYGFFFKNYFIKIFIWTLRLHFWQTFQKRLPKVRKFLAQTLKMMKELGSISENSSSESSSGRIGCNFDNLAKICFVKSPKYSRSKYENDEKLKFFKKLFFLKLFPGHTDCFYDKLANIFPPKKMINFCR